MEAIPAEIINLLAQFPILAIFYFAWRSQMEAHAKSIEHYREQQRRTVEWIQRLFEVWAAEELKKSSEELTATKPTRPGAGD